MQRFIVLICGLLFLGIGVFLYARNNYLIKNCTVETEATVVDMKQDFTADSDSSTYTYYPIIEYKVGENTIRATSDKGSSVPAYDINQTITILYNPNKVKEFYIKGEKSNMIFGIVFMSIGALISAYGIKVALKKD